MSLEEVARGKRDSDAITGRDPREHLRTMKLDELEALVDTLFLHIAYALEVIEEKGGKIS